MSQIAKAIEIARQLEEVVSGLSIDQIGQHLDNAGLADVVRFQAELRELKDSLAESTKGTNKIYDLIRKSVVPTRMEDEGLESTRVTGVGTVSLQTEIYASIRGGMQEDAFQYLTDIGSDAIIKSTVNASSLKALAKQKIQEGDPLSDEYFNITVGSVAQIRKAK